MNDFITQHFLWIAGLIGLGVMLLGVEYVIKRNGIPQIAVSTLIDLLNNHGGVAVDSRDPKIFQQGYLQGAINIPFSERARLIKSLEAYRGKPIILYGQEDSSQELKAMLQILKQAGHLTLYRLQGGVMALQYAHIPLNRK